MLDPYALFQAELHQQFASMAEAEFYFEQEWANRRPRGCAERAKRGIAYDKVLNARQAFCEFLFSHDWCHLVFANTVIKFVREVRPEQVIDDASFPCSPFGDSAKERLNLFIHLNFIYMGFRENTDRMRLFVEEYITPQLSLTEVEIIECALKNWFPKRWDEMTQEERDQEEQQRLRGIEQRKDEARRRALLKEEYEIFLRSELKEIAKQRKLKGYSKLNKPQLIQLLKDNPLSLFP